MAGFFAGLNSKLMGMLPELLRTAEPQIQASVTDAVSKMPPNKAAVVKANMQKLNDAVQAAPIAQLPVQAGKRKKTSKKTRRIKRK